MSDAPSIVVNICRVRKQRNTIYIIHGKIDSANAHKKLANKTNYSLLANNALSVCALIRQIAS